MNDDLDELKSRVVATREEIAALEVNTNSFLKGAIDVEGVPGRLGRYDVYARQLKPTPVLLRTKAGMIANELRSILDGLACSLAERNGNEPRNTYFPISKSETIFRSDGLRKIKLLSPADQKLISDIKPYKEGSPKLYALHEADKLRKHIRLNSMGSAHGAASIAGVIKTSVPLSFSNVRINDTDVDGLAFHGFQEISEIGKGYLLVSGARRDHDMSFQFAITYSTPEIIAGVNVIDSLNEWTNLVADIISRFEQPPSP